MIRVAIVDTDESYARAVARLLRASGMEASTVAPGEPFLDITRRSEVDCLLLDLRLGGTTVPEASDWAGAVHARPAVVFLSEDEGTSAPGAAAGCGCAVVRLSDPAETLVRAIRRAVEALVDSP